MHIKVTKLVVLICGTGLACVESLHAGQCMPSRHKFTLATIASLSAAPGEINFRANNPDVGVVSGFCPGSLTWMIMSGSHLQNWTLSVQAGASSFPGCPTVPLSAIKVNCSTATVSGGAGTGSCRSPFTLSTSAQQIAGGMEGDGTNSYSVSVIFTVAESWRYVANPACSITITYSVNAP